MKPLDPRLLHYAHATRVFILASIAIGAVTAGLMVVQAFLIADVIAAAFSGAALDDVGPQLMWLVGVSLARAVLTWLSAAIGHAAGAQAVSQLRAAMMARALELGPAFLSGARQGELVALSTRGASSLEAYFSGYLPQLVLAVVVPLIVGVAMLTQDPLSALIVVLTIPIIPVFMILIGKYTQSRVERQWATLGVLTGHFLDVVAGLATLKMFGRAKAQAETISRVGEQYRRATMGVLRVSFLSALVLEIMATLSVAIIAVAIGLRLVAGTMDLRTGLTVLILAPEVYMPLRQIGLAFHAAAEGVGAAEKMFEVLESPPSQRGHRADIEVGRATILFEDVGVTYGTREGLSPVSFQILPGQVTAVVGPSGSGKSTIVGVLMGLVGAPSAQVTGAVRLQRDPGGAAPGESVALAQLDPDWWRAQIGWVPQSPAMLAGTVANNVRLGKPGASDAAVAASLRAAGLDPDDLRDGLETVIGDGGSGISVGQARRVGIARALVRDPQIYLLDEPTAALDTGRESDVLETVMALSRRGRTVLVVTHRQAVIDLADHVVVVDLPHPDPEDGVAVGARQVAVL